MDLHAYLTDWLGKGIGDPEHLDIVLEPSFRMVTPTGIVLERGQVLAWLRAARGQRGNALTIDILDAEATAVGTHHMLVNYIERQSLLPIVQSRRSSALLTLSDKAPNGVAWLHLHETWISPPE